jgi:hypothetical protein
MMKRPVRFLLIAAAGAAALWAEAPVLVFPKLPQPLKLPPGLVETLPLNKTNSFFGDSLRAVDCADELDLPYGTCGNQLFGGLAMTSSHLSGSIEIRFSPPIGNITHFVVTHGVLRGDDSVLQAPQGFEMPVLFNQIGDDPGGLSSGDLDLTTGGVTNIDYRVDFLNSALLSLGGVNPKLVAPVIRFPGVRGQAWARFDQRPDGLLDFTIQGNTFLPLGKDVLGDPVRFPLPMCGPGLICASVLARGTSLHPHLMLSTKEPLGPECGNNCPDIPFNTVQQFTLWTYASAFGDDFNIDNPLMGGTGAGRSHLQGRLQIQFGPKTGDTVPFVITSLVPQGLLANAPENSILGHGPVPGMLGQEEILSFPLVSYHLRNVVLVDEPYSFNHGMINLKTGRVLGEMVYPLFFGQSLASELFTENNGRVEKVPFFLVAKDQGPNSPTYALFEKNTNGETVFRYSGEHTRSFYTYLFPAPSFIPSDAFTGGLNSTLDLFTRLQATHIAETPTGVLSGGGNNILSSLGDRFSYSYSIPCNPAGAPFSFTYTNNSTGSNGGTFTMTRLASVSCINSRGSTLPPGNYDSVEFGGFGTWSKDAADANPRFATVHISTAPGAPYVGVLVYMDPDPSQNVILSCANTKPAEKPLP